MSYDLDDKQTEEAMSHLADYVDHLPLWHLAGHTAAEYPSEAFVRKLTVREPLGLPTEHHASCPAAQYTATIP